MNLYKDSEILNRYLLFHYGKDSDLIPFDFGPKDSLNFPRRCIEELVDFKGARALDLGCSVGGSSFELSKHFESVIGIDFSEAFIQLGLKLKNEKSLSIEVKKEGDISKNIEVRLPKDVYPSRVDFFSGDAQEVDSKYFGSDLVFAGNLLCRLPEPQKFLNSLKNLVRKNGKLILVSPYTWLEEFTKKEKWLCANGSSEDAIVNILADDFSLTNKKEMPFLIRRHKRMYHWGVSQALVFTRS